MKFIQAAGALVMVVALTGWIKPKPTYVFYRVGGSEEAFLHDANECHKRDANFNAALVTAGFVGRENVYYRCMRARGYSTQTLSDAERAEVANLPSRAAVVSWVTERRKSLSSDGSPRAVAVTRKPEIIE